MEQLHAPCQEYHPFPGGLEVPILMHLTHESNAMFDSSTLKLNINFIKSLHCHKKRKDSLETQVSYI